MPHVNVGELRFSESTKIRRSIEGNLASYVEFLEGEPGAFFAEVKSRAPSLLAEKSRGAVAAPAKAIGYYSDAIRELKAISGQLGELGDDEIEPHWRTITEKINACANHARTACLLIRSNAAIDKPNETYAEIRSKAFLVVDRLSNVVLFDDSIAAGVLLTDNAIADTLSRGCTYTAMCKLLQCNKRGSLEYVAGLIAEQVDETVEEASRANADVYLLSWSDTRRSYVFADYGYVDAFAEDYAAHILSDPSGLRDRLAREIAAAAEAQLLHNEAYGQLQAMVPEAVAEWLAESRGALRVERIVVKALEAKKLVLVP